MKTIISFLVAVVIISLCVGCDRTPNASKPLTVKAKEKKSIETSKVKTKTSSANTKQSSIKSSVASSDMIPSTVVLYQQQEKGIKPYITRYIVNKRYMRIDDGKIGQGFVLLDRVKNQVYSISAEDETVLVVPKSDKQVDIPKNQVMRIVPRPLPKTLMLEGKKAVDQEFLVGNKSCFRMVTVKGVLPDYVNAMQQYYAILAGQHAKNMFKTPVNMRDTCFIMYDVKFHKIYSFYGLIIQKWDTKGKKRQLGDYKHNVKVNSALFQLPKNYRKYKVGEVPSFK